jgi:glucan phosphorylase
MSSVLPKLYLARHGDTAWTDSHQHTGRTDIPLNERDTLLTHGDHYMHLADLKSYLEADQGLVELYGDPDAWARKAVLNVAASGKFSSDRTIAEYAAGIWNAEPCPVS